MPKIDLATTAPAAQEADVLVLPVFQGPEPGPGVDDAGKALDADLAGILERNGLTGKRGETLTVPTFSRLPAASVLLVGLGRKDEATPDVVRRAVGKVASRLRSYGHVATTLPRAVPRAWEAAIGALVEGLLLGSYSFDRYKAKEDEAKLRRVTVLGSGRWDERKAARAIREGEVLAASAAWARDLVNTPALDATPDFLAKEARRMARETGLKVKVWTKAQLEQGGFGGILGVGAGSRNDPRLIELTYEGGRGAPIALTGKGVTFDSGGLSLKDSKGMEWMKADMAGAASILGAMRAVAELKPKVNVIAAIPSAENMPGGGAIRPGDVLTHRGGTTTEVLNTDAEGRLILADALAYLSEKEPRLIVDTATLTGACVVALGQQLWGVIGTDDGLIEDLLDAGEQVGEPGWRLPLWEGYREQLKSNVADIKNIGDRWGGAINAALFLSTFVGDGIPWAHVDIAGVAFAQTPGDYWGKGGTGVPVRTLYRFIRDAAG